MPYQEMFGRRAPAFIGHQVSLGNRFAVSGNEWTACTRVMPHQWSGRNLYGVSGYAW